MSDPRRNDVRSSYDRVADEYVKRIYGELQHKPLDRQLLDRFAYCARGGVACDMGCGPGHAAAYLNAQGTSICGVHLSAAMVLRARRLNPGLRFIQGDMQALGIADEAFTGIVAFYSLIHVERDRVEGTLAELRRVLQPEGVLFLAFHLGEDSLHMDEWWGHRVCVDFVFFRSSEMTRYLSAAGFEVEDVIERDPYPDVEHPSRRSYIFARKPG